jgi:hypothetical protein
MQQSSILTKYLAATVVGLLGVVASAKASDLARLLSDAMKPNSSKTARHVEPRVPIRALIKAGYLRKKPEARVDYSDYRLVRKPFDFLGARLVVIEEQYMITYGGCCVDPGIGMVLENPGNSSDIAELAKSNSCTYSDDEDNYFVDAALEAVGRKGQRGRFIYLYCGMRELEGY